MRGWFAVLFLAQVIARQFFRWGECAAPRYFRLCLVLGNLIGAAGIVLYMTAAARSGGFLAHIVTAVGCAVYLLIQSMRYVGRRELLSEAAEIELMMLFLFAFFLALVLADRFMPPESAAIPLGVPRN